MKEVLEAIAQHYNQQPRWLSENQIELITPASISDKSTPFRVSLFVEQGSAIADPNLQWLDEQLRWGYNEIVYRSQLKDDRSSGWAVYHKRYPAGFDYEASRDRVE